MALTPEQIAKMRQKEASMPDALKRDALTDYREGFFFVTLNTRNEAPILSTVAGHVGSEGPDAPHCEYTELGEKVKEVIASIPSFHKYCEVIDAEVMPEHLHILLHLQQGGTEHLGKIIGGFMGGCSHAYWDTLGIDWRKGHPTQGRQQPSTNNQQPGTNNQQQATNNQQPGANNQQQAAPGDAAASAPANTSTPPTSTTTPPANGTTPTTNTTTPPANGSTPPTTPPTNGTTPPPHAAPPDRDRDHTRSYRGPSLFVRGYNDVEALTPEQVQIKIDYIRHQAEKRLIKGDKHACFRIMRHAHSHNWTPEAPTRAISNDRFFARNAEAMRAALHAVQQRLDTDKEGLALSYLGHRPLLASQYKLPLVCHRADAPFFEQQKNAVLNAARNGWIIVSAFISPKEREIKNQLMVEMLPFIEIMDNGFSDRHKPSGKAFYACGENRLVQISCWAYQYQKNSQISREMCLVMNELARIISGRPDDWWKKTTVE